MTRHINDPVPFMRARAAVSARAVQCDLSLDPLLLASHLGTDTFLQSEGGRHAMPCAWIASMDEAPSGSLELELNSRCGTTDAWLDAASTIREISGESWWRQFELNTQLERARTTPGRRSWGAQHLQLGP